MLIFVTIRFVISPPEYAQEAVLPLCYLLSLCGAIQLGFWLRQHDLVERCIFWLAIFFIIGSAYSVAVQMVQLQWPGVRVPFMIPRMETYNPYGNIGQTNHLASYLAIGWAALNYLLFRGTIRLKIYFPFSFFLFLGLVLTGQRSAFIYVLCLSAIFSCIPAVSRAEGSLRQRAAWLWCMPIVYLLMSFFLPIIVNTFSAQFLSASDRLHDGWGLRFQMLHVGWSLFLEAPWFGIGWGNLASYQFLKADVLPTVPANHVHNIVVQLLAETGIFCTAIVFVVLFFWFRRFIKFPSSREKQFALGMIAVLALHSLVEYPLWYAYFLFPIGLVVGMFESDGLKLKVPPILTNILIKGLNCVAVVVLYFSFFEALYVTDMYSRRAYTYSTQVMRDEELNEIARMPSRFFLKPYVDYIDSTGRPFDGKNAVESIAINRRLLNTLIDNNVIVRRSIYLASAGKDEEAKNTFLRMKKIFPNETPEMLKVIARAANNEKNDNLIKFSQWATEDSAPK